MSITAHVHQRYVRATADQLWEAITEPEWTRRYLHGRHYADPPAVGSSFRLLDAAGNPAVDGEVEALEAPRRLVLTWRLLTDPALATEPPGRVEWQLDPVGERLTRLRLVHGDLAFSPLTWAAVEHDWGWVLDSLKSLLESGESLPEVEAEPAEPADRADAVWHRRQAVEANNDAWELIERTGSDLDAGRTEELLRLVYTAAYHWDLAADRTPENAARAAYMIAKALLIAGRSEAALGSADRAMAICLQHNLSDFDLAYAYEARARALAALGRIAEADEAWATARAVPIADDEDREILQRDFAVP